MTQDFLSFPFNVTSDVFTQIVASVPGIYQIYNTWNWKGIGNETIITSPTRVALDLNGEGLTAITPTDIDVTQSASWDTGLSTDYTVNTNRSGKWFYIWVYSNAGTMSYLLSDSGSTLNSGVGSARAIEKFYFYDSALLNYLGLEDVSVTEGDIDSMSFSSLTGKSITMQAGPSLPDASADSVLFYDTNNGSIYLSAGGDWRALSIQSSINDFDFAIGTVIEQMGDSIPTGCIALDNTNQLLSSVAYPKLYDLYSTKYGGDGSTFGLPTIAQASGETYDTGWIARSEWRNKHLGSDTTKNVDSLVSLPFSFTDLGDLNITFLINSAATDIGAQEPRTNTSGTGNRGYGIEQIDATSLRIQTGSNGVTYINGSGSDVPVDTEDWFYKIIVIKDNPVAEDIKLCVYVGNGSVTAAIDTHIDERLTAIENLPIFSDTPYDTGWITPVSWTNQHLNHFLPEEMRSDTLADFDWTLEFRDSDTYPQTSTQLYNLAENGTEGSLGVRYYNDTNQFTLRTNNGGVYVASPNSGTPLLLTIQTDWQYRLVIRKKNAVSFMTATSPFINKKDWVTVWEDANNTVDIPNTWGKGTYRVTLLKSDSHYPSIITITDKAYTEGTASGGATDNNRVSFNTATGNFRGTASANGLPIITKIERWQDTTGADKPSVVLDDGWETVWTGSSNQVELSDMSNSADGLYMAIVEVSTNDFLTSYINITTGQDTFSSSFVALSDSTNRGYINKNASHSYLRWNGAGIYVSRPITKVRKYKGVYTLDINHTNVNIEGDNSTIIELDTTNDSIVIEQKHLPTPIPEGFSATFVNSGTGSNIVTTVGSDVPELPDNVIIPTQQAVKFVGVNGMWRLLDSLHIDPVINQKDWVEVWSGSKIDTIPNTWGLGRYNLLAQDDNGRTFNTIVEVTQFGADSYPTSYTRSTTDGVRYIHNSSNDFKCYEDGSFYPGIGFIRIEKWETVTGLNKPTTPLSNSFVKIYSDWTNTSNVPLSSLSEMGNGQFFAILASTTNRNTDNPRTSTVFIDNYTLPGDSLGGTTTTSTDRRVQWDGTSQHFECQDPSYYVKEIYWNKGVYTLDINHTNVHIEGDNSEIIELDTSSNDITLSNSNITGTINDGYTITLINSGNGDKVVTTLGTDITGMPTNLLLTAQQALKLVYVNGVWRVLEGHTANLTLDKKDWVTIYDDIANTADVLNIWGAGSYKVWVKNDSTPWGNDDGLATAIIDIGDTDAMNAVSIQVGPGTSTTDLMVKYNTTSGTNLFGITAAGSYLGTSGIVRIDKWEDTVGNDLSANPIHDGWEEVFDDPTGDTLVENTWGNGYYKFIVKFADDSFSTHTMEVTDEATIGNEYSSQFGVGASNYVYVTYNNSKQFIPTSVGWTNNGIVKIWKYKGVMNLDINHSNVHVEGDNSDIHNLDTTTGDITIDTTYLPGPYSEGYSATFYNNGSNGNFLTTMGTDLANMPTNIIVANGQAIRFVYINNEWALLDSHTANLTLDKKDWVTIYEDFSTVDYQMVHAIPDGHYRLTVGRLNADFYSIQMTIDSTLNGGNANFTSPFSSTGWIGYTCSTGQWNSNSDLYGVMRIERFQDTVGNDLSAQPIDDGWETVWTGNSKSIVKADWYQGDGQYFVLQDSDASHVYKISGYGYLADGMHGRLTSFDSGWQVQTDSSGLMTNVHVDYSIVEIKKFKGVMNLDINHSNVHVEGDNSTIHNLDTTSGDITITTATHMPGPYSEGHTVVFYNNGSNGNMITTINTDVVGLPDNIILTNKQALKLIYINSVWTVFEGFTANVSLDRKDWVEVWSGGFGDETYLPNTWGDGKYRMTGERAGGNDAFIMDVEHKDGLTDYDQSMLLATTGDNQIRGQHYQGSNLFGFTGVGTYAGAARITRLEKWQDTVGSVAPSLPIDEGWEEVYDNDSNTSNDVAMSLLSSGGLGKYEVHCQNGSNLVNFTVELTIENFISGRTFSSPLFRGQTGTDTHVYVQFHVNDDKFNIISGGATYYIRKIKKWTGIMTLNVNTNVVEFDGATKSIDGTLATNSDSLIPTEKAVKSYVDNQSLDLTSVDGDILPEMTGATGNVSVRNIGSDTQRFNSVYADEVFVGASSLYVNGKKVIEDAANTMTFATDTDQGLQLKTTASVDGAGNGNVDFISDNQISNTAKGHINFNVASNVAGKNIVFTNSSTGGIIQFNGKAEFNGDVTFNGGSITEIKTATTLLTDNIIELNAEQVGTPPTSLKSGFSINRGDSPDYRVIFDEDDDLLKIGENGSEVEVLTVDSTIDASRLGGSLPSDYLKRQQSFTFNNLGSNVTVATFKTESGKTADDAATYKAPLQIWQTTADADAFMSFEIVGDSGAYFGLDGTTNDLFVGGQSFGAVKHRVWHEGNDVNIAKTVGYKTAAQMDNNTTLESGFYTVNNTESVTLGLTNDWHHIINMHHFDDNGWNTQIAITFHSNDTMKMRGSAGGTWTAWASVGSGGGSNVTSQSSFPSSPSLGDECWRTDLDQWWKYNGVTWTQI